MIKHINTGVAELIAVKVPEDKMHIMEQYPHGYFYMHYGAPTMDRSNTVYLAYKYGGATHYLVKMGIEKDFQSKYISLGIAHELAEEVWATILPVAARYERLRKTTYKSFFNPKVHFDTATESGLSLLEANEVYAVNPYFDPENTMRQGHGFVYYGASDEEFVQYEQAQQNVGKWVLLKKASI